MAKNTTRLERKFYFATFLALLFGVFTFIPKDTIYISPLPYPEIVCPCIHIVIGLFFLLFAIFNKEMPIKLQVMLYSIECIINFLLNKYILSQNLFLIIQMILYCNGYFSINGKRKKYIMYIFFIACNFIVIYFGIQDFLLSLAFTAFYCVFLKFIHKQLIVFLTYSKPIGIPAKSTMIYPKPGLYLDLHNFNLSDRQIKEIRLHLYKGFTYAQIAKKLNLSTSLVKKDFSDAFKNLDVKNLKELHILLSQYNLDANADINSKFQNQETF